MKTAAFVLAGLLLLVTGAWLIVLPGSYIQGLIENSLANPDLKVEVSGLKKGLFYNVTADRISLAKDGVELIAVDQVRARANPFSLLLLRLDMHFSASVGGGEVSGRLNLMQGGRNITIGVEKADLAAIPLFSRLGIKGSGVLSGRVVMDRGGGEARLDISGARLQSASFGAIAVPLNFFDRARAALAVSGGGLTVTSFALEGADIYARIKGKVAAGRMDLTMEVMPEQSFTERNPSAALLEPFRVSPGYYVIPVKGDLPF